jgi:hypothetical protein
MLVARAGTAHGESATEVRESMQEGAHGDDRVRQVGAALNELRRTVMYLARVERVAASPPQYLIKLLTSIVECTRTPDADRDVVHALEVDVILWGIEAYLAA